MAHFAAPTTHRGSIFSPIADLYPCRLIGGACNTLKELAKKIANFVGPIFTKFVEFIGSFLPGHGAAAPEQIETSPQVLRRGAIPSAFHGSDIAEQAAAFLRQLLDRFHETFGSFDIRQITQNPEATRQTFARLLILNLFRDTTVPLPLSIPLSVGIGWKPSMYNPIVLDLRRRFNELPRQDRLTIIYDFGVGNTALEATRPYENPGAAIAFMVQAYAFVTGF
ncbi:MAG TPA: hypothetical protein VIJ46_04600, partial [Rhabdochlamydiaceae bacterium]